MKKVPLLVLKELGYIYQLYQLCQFHWHHSLGWYQAGLNYMEKSMINGDLVVNYMGNSWKIHSSWWFIGETMASSGI